MNSILKEGSVLGGILLIAGSCIGAGMLALPVITGIGGFLPAMALFIFSWLFMTTTALLLLEANLKVGHDLSLISISEKTLGKTGKVLCWLLFIFLFYSLNIAYIAASGSIVQSLIFDLMHLTLPAWMGSALFTVLFGIVVFMGTRKVDYLNRILMLGLIISYCALVLIGTSYIQPHFLLVNNWPFAFAALPVLIISFGFHNMVPSLAMYFKGDALRLRRTLLIGGLIPLLIYLLWEAVMLGIIPITGREGLLHALDQGQAATTALKSVVGKSWVNTVSHLFALFAIITSFLAQSLSLVDFLSDGLKIPKVKRGRIVLIALTLIPPFLFAFVYPDIFITALNLAGGISAVILFGILPTLMVWKLRYHTQHKVRGLTLVPLGRPLLVVILIVAIAIFTLEVLQELGISLIPSYVEALP